MADKEKPPVRGDIRYREVEEYKYHSKVWDKKLKTYVSVYTKNYPKVLEQFNGDFWQRVPEEYSWASELVYL